MSQEPYNKKEQAKELTRAEAEVTHEFWKELVSRGMTRKEATDITVAWLLAKGSRVA